MKQSFITKFVGTKSWRWRETLNTERWDLQILQILIYGTSCDCSWETPEGKPFLECIRLLHSLFVLHLSPLTNKTISNVASPRSLSCHWPRLRLLVLLSLMLCTVYTHSSLLLLVIQNCAYLFLSVLAFLCEIHFFESRPVCVIDLGEVRGA